jgi:hypothetical protein
MRTADEVLRAAEDCLNLACDHETEHVEGMLGREALRLARGGRWDDSFRIFTSVRLNVYSDPQLFRLRNALLHYEQKRIARVRRRLVYVLLGVLGYLFAVAPSVFVALENPYRISHGMSELDWSEGLYWSVITSTTVGYGDVVPYTPFGRMFALFDALLGVLLMGVTAGLILSVLTPRRLD